METRRLEGIGHQIKGRMKETFGRLIGDAKRAADGTAERVIGDAQNTAGERALGRILGDAKLMVDGSAETSAGKAQYAAGGARDEATQPDKASQTANVDQKPDAGS